MGSSEDMRSFERKLGTVDNSSGADGGVPPEPSQLGAVIDVKRLCPIKYVRWNATTAFNTVKSSFLNSVVTLIVKGKRIEDTRRKVRWPGM
jgi:hypothetical protein